MFAYIIQDNGYYGGTITLPDDPNHVNGIPYGTTLTAPPDNPNNLYLYWGGSSWNLISTPPYDPTANTDTTTSS